MIFSTLLGAAILCPVLLAISVADIRRYRIPDSLSLPLLAAGLVFALAFSELRFADHVIGATVGFGVLALFGEVYFRLRGRDGLGLGDAKLMGAAGAWLGWGGLPFLLLVASLTGLATALAVPRYRREARIPFGPCIALAFLLVWMTGAPGHPPLWR